MTFFFPCLANKTRKGNHATFIYLLLLLFFSNFTCEVNRGVNIMT